MHIVIDDFIVKKEFLFLDLSWLQRNVIVSVQILENSNLIDFFTVLHFSSALSKNNL